MIARDIEFFEKPGCINNSRQKRILSSLGHRVHARDLLREPWSPDGLRPFFGDRPVIQWFNRSAPRIKSGEVVPGMLDMSQALALMIADPLLIRRPLIRCDLGLTAGFEEGPVLGGLGVFLAPDDDLQTCAREQVSGTGREADA